jgi:hypothetical protein
MNTTSTTRGKHLTTTGPFLLIGNSDKVNLLKNDIIQTIKGKAGGKPGKLQGVAQQLSIANLELIKILLKKSFIL